MLVNSFDAMASVFRIDVSKCGEKMVLVVSDDGKGIPPHQEVHEGLFGFGNTTRSDGLGCALALGRAQLQKIASEIRYKGVGVDGKGASFELLFLKRMPK
jgi:C4-dicarboxylate-specific signal transduction histidine kinase